MRLLLQSVNAFGLFQVKEEIYIDTYHGKMHLMTPGLNRCQVHFFFIHDLSIDNHTTPIRYCIFTKMYLDMSVQPRGHQVQSVHLEVHMFFICGRVSDPGAGGTRKMLR